MNEYWVSFLVDLIPIIICVIFLSIGLHSLAAAGSFGWDLSLLKRSPRWPEYNRRTGLTILSGYLSQTSITAGPVSEAPCAWWRVIAYGPNTRYGRGVAGKACSSDPLKIRDQNNELSIATDARTLYMPETSVGLGSRNLPKYESLLQTMKKQERWWMLWKLPWVAKLTEARIPSECSVVAVGHIPGVGSGNRSVAHKQDTATDRMITKVAFISSRSLQELTSFLTRNALFRLLIAGVFVCLGIWGLLPGPSDWRAKFLHNIMGHIR